MNLVELELDYKIAIKCYRDLTLDSEDYAKGYREARLRLLEELLLIPENQREPSYWKLATHTAQDNEPQRMATS